MGFIKVDPVSGRSTPGRVPVMEENNMSRAICVIMRPCRKKVPYTQCCRKRIPKSSALKMFFRLARLLTLCSTGGTFSRYYHAVQFDYSCRRNSSHLLMGECIHGPASKQCKVLTQSPPVFILGRLDLLFRCAVHPVKKIHVHWWILREQELHIIDVHMRAVPGCTMRVSQEHHEIKQ